MAGSSGKISVVVPVYNEQKNIPVLYDALRKVFDRLARPYEILFIDDGSTDASFRVIREISGQDGNIHGISFSRNFGHQAAILAGLERTTGELIITMDADLQHPPEVIPLLIDKHLEGYQVVNTRRRDKKASVFKRITSTLFYRLLNFFSDIRIPEASSDFRLMSRTALDAFLRFTERARFNRGLVGWMGFEQATLQYEAPERHSGTTKYSFRKMRVLAVDGITSFSTRPLRISTYLGLIVFLAGFIYAVYSLIQYARGNTIPGWTSLMTVVLVIGGIQLLSLGIIGEYLARVFNESKGRPLYFIKDQTR